MAQATFGPESSQLLTSLDFLAALYIDLRQFDKAESVLQRMVAIEENTPGKDTPAVADIIDSLAILYENDNKLSESEALFALSLAIRETAFGKENPAVGASLFNLAQVYRLQGRYTKAEPLLQRYVLIRQQSPDPDNPAVANALYSLAEVYRAEERLPEAETLFRKALSIDEKAPDPKHAYVAKDLTALALTCAGQSKFTEAERLYRLALAVPDNPELSSTLFDLGLLYDQQGRYADAEAQYDRALKIDQGANDEKAVASDLADLGSLYQDQGKYAQSEPILKRALEIDERVLGPNDPRVAVTLDALVELYLVEGRYGDGEINARRSLDIREQALGKDHPQVAHSLGNLATLYMGENRYAEAEPLLQRALAITEKSVGEDNMRTAIALNDLAVLYQDERKPAAAEPLLIQALAIYEKSLGKDNLGLYVPLSNLGRAYYDLAKYNEADSVFQRVLAIGTKTLGNDNPKAVTWLIDLAVLRYAEGKFVEAESLFALVSKNIQQQLRDQGTYLTEQDRLSFLNTIAFEVPMYSSFCLTYRDRDPELLGKMYDLLLWEKGFVANSVASLQAQVARMGDNDTVMLFQRFVATRAQLASLEVPTTPNDEHWRLRMESLRHDEDDLETNLVRRVGSLAENENMSQTTWRDVQNRLKPNEAAVEFLRFEYDDGKQWSGKSYYVALVLRASGFPVQVGLGEANAMESGPLVDYLKRVAKVPAEGAGLDFYRTFWKPLEPYLPEHGRVYISPDGVLNEVSLAAIPTEDGQLLLDKYDLQIVLSTKDLLRVANPGGQNTAVLIGNPKFNLDAAQHKTQFRELQSTEGDPVQIAASFRPESISGSQSADADCPYIPPGGMLCPLLGTQIEVDSIFSQLKKAGWNVQPPYTQERASKDVVKQVQHPRLLHIATHGFFLPEQEQQKSGFGMQQAMVLEDPMLRSGLYFAGADRALEGELAPGDSNDGILTAYEASTLDLQGTEIVVLSACDTGLGEIRNGEGVFGLRRALQEAGAQSVLMSMWPVPDDETQELMSLFYEKWLGGIEKHEALREAQHEMRDQIKTRWDGEDRPYYWGAFVIVGP